MSKCENCIYFVSKEEPYFYCKKFDREMDCQPTVCEAFSDKIEGLKYDNGKNRMGLMCENFSRALW